MLSTDKISGAFKAIIEEADKLQNKDLPGKVQRRIKTIISIAKHQSDIRKSPKGTCTTKKNSSSK